jgi:ATP-dependent Clp protease ATP-binding subunit ClpA
VGSEHLLLGLTSVEGLARSVLAELGVDRAAVLAAVAGPDRDVDRTHGTTVPFTDAALGAIRRAADEAAARRSPEVGTGDLLLGVLADDGAAARVLASLGVDRATARDRAEAALRAGGRDTP